MGGGVGSSSTERGCALVSAGRERTKTGGGRRSTEVDGVNVGDARGVPALEFADGTLFAMAVELDSTSPSYVGESTPLSEDRTAAIRGGAWWRLRCWGATRDWTAESVVDDE